MCINRNTRYSHDKRSRRIRIWTIAIAIYTTSSTAHKSIFGKIDIIQLREYFLFQHHGITIISKLKAKVEKGEERKEATLIENGVTNGLLLQHSNVYFPLHGMFCVLIRIYKPTTNNEIIFLSSLIKYYSNKKETGDQEFIVDPCYAVFATLP